LPGGYLFPCLDPMDSLSTRHLNRAVREAARAAHVAIKSEKKPTKRATSRRHGSIVP
jgi:hypothetical protein